MREGVPRIDGPGRGRLVVLIRRSVRLRRSGGRGVVVARVVLSRLVLGRLVCDEEQSAARRRLGGCRRLRAGLRAACTRVPGGCLVLLLDRRILARLPQTARGLGDVVQSGPCGGVGIARGVRGIAGGAQGGEVGEDPFGGVHSVVVGVGHVWSLLSTIGTPHLRPDRGRSSAPGRLLRARKPAVRVPGSRGCARRPGTSRFCLCDRREGSHAAD